MSETKFYTHIIQIGKITFLCILIFILLDSKLEEQIILVSHKELADAKLSLCPASGPSSCLPTDRPHSILCPMEKHISQITVTLPLNQLTNQS